VIPKTVFAYQALLHIPSLKILPNVDKTCCVSPSGHTQSSRKTDPMKIKNNLRSSSIEL